VPNKIKVLKKVKNANISSDYITDYMTENKILDKDDLNRYFLKFKENIIKNKNENWNEIYLSIKENLNLRFHQELIVDKTSKLIEEGNKSFLWGCKCRSGKTYMIGGIIIKQLNIKKKLNVLIITPSPTETIPQFTDDLFNKFKDFNKFKIHNINCSSLINDIEIAENNIFVMSKQLLQQYVNENTIIKIKNLKLDIIGFDENHFSGTTEISKNILISYCSKNTIKIYLTATYNKPLKEWEILPECQIFWDIEDEQICKSILIDNEKIMKLQEKHGLYYVNKTLDYYKNLGLTINDIFKCYKKMPDLHLITNMFDSQRYEIIKEKLNNENKMGFCFDTLFGLNKLKTKFSYKDEVKTFIRYISGSFKEEDGEKTIFTRINKICSEKETRIPFTQIWFLPSNNINEISECLKELMKEDLILKKYEILCINRKNKDLIKDVKDEINKKGVILLAGNMLSLGITLNLCDLVILLNNTISSDKVFQEMYRCMTEGKNKKIGFVVDLNISRVLNTCINYTTYKNEKSIDDKIKYLIKNNLINIDIDMLLNKDNNVDIIINKLINIWKEDPVNNFKILLRRLDNDFIEFDSSTQQLINKTFTKSVKDDKISSKVSFNNDTIQELPTGKEIIINDNNIDEITNIDNTDTIDEEKKQKEIQILFSKDVLKYIIPLSCLLTIKNKNMDFIKILNDIKENPELLETFDDQCLIWWNKKDLIDFIKNIVNNNYDSQTNAYNTTLQIKMQLQSLIDNPKELLELITECLKPKDIEKKQFGEVFTPMFLVNDMLSKLPEQVWKNKDLKWFDPCCGMGNFPIAIYLKLMDTLKDIIIDDKKRKKHILENMLYMSELNKKNVLLCNQIFDIKNEYKLNIYGGDSLNVDYNKIFKVKNFDIIVGNPPYQDSSGNKGKGHALWTKFVELSLTKLLKQNGYLVFVHPSLWRQIEHPCLELIKSKQLLYLEIHNSNDGMKTFKCATRYDWYVLHNVNNTKETIIKGEDGIICNIQLNEWQFIPNMMFNEIKNLISNNKNKLDINNYRSNYGADKKWVSKIKSEEFKYPIIYTINKNNILTIYYSNTNQNGHFGLSKFIFSNGAGFYCDEIGQYGLTQWSYCIYDIKENLNKIHKAFQSKKFNIIKNAIQLDSSTYNIKVMKLFKKDFYNDFIDNNNVIKNTNNINNFNYDEQIKKFNENIEFFETLKNKILNSKKIL
jgi:hypothetical protein